MEPKLNPNKNPQGAQTYARYQSLAWGVMGTGLAITGGLAWIIRSLVPAKEKNSIE
eukprot:CAMPEP_0201522662 /NCGR_PEP_ID=MMETSP0161_2-20130828/18474_1 /ASSEMBLY_ACC=CAM_ASM_000251 /TAXON_ID=180227 /ORGANISM="Neoparamoeba aestuarina, Strain SoJaBio B1-5/56/2" /LENGTH=55 /DNA_ID=CAMNT_0047921573 /DNA_START=197 /DNA_END=364 /DNA_ORIENTATION=+